jgi:SAM-dependent methyltransferase
VHPAAEPLHPEAEAVHRRLLADWRVLEVGCGSSPTPGATVTLDRTPAGSLGGAGVEAGQVSLAGVGGDMAALPFRDDAFDAVISRHVLEHHADTIAVLREWRRVARHIIVVTPDQRDYPGSTIALDPTHVAAFTPEQLAHLAPYAGLHAIDFMVPVPRWSFLIHLVRRTA